MSSIPLHLIKSLQDYNNHGIPTGAFLRACLKNDFADAVSRADDQSILVIRDIARYIRNEVDWNKRGGPGEVKTWIDKCALARAVEREEADARTD